MFRTYQMKLKNEMIVLLDCSEIPVYDYFQQYAKEFGRIERRLFVDVYVRKRPTNQLKIEYCANYQLTARQYNSIKNHDPQKSLDSSRDDCVMWLYTFDVKVQAFQCES